jgi:hypothetical protein
MPPIFGMIVPLFLPIPGTLLSLLLALIILRGELISLIRNINDSLLFNRNILKILCKGKKTRLKKQQLLNRGFDFEMMTNVYHTKKNEYYIVVYDYAYRFISEEEILLIKYL